MAIAGFWDASHAVDVSDLEGGGVSILVTGKPLFGEQVWTTTFNVYCGKETSPVGSTETTKITLGFSHPDACGGGDSGLSGGSIFLIILLCVTVVYVIAGCVYNVKRNQTPLGCASCPNKDFWFAIPGLAKAGCAFTVLKIKGCVGGSGSSSAAAAEGSGYGSV